MPTIDNWDLTFELDQVLRGQGADPDIILRRSPNLIGLAERAIAEGSPLLAPKLIYRRMAVESVVHERLALAGGAKLQSKILAQHLYAAEEVILIVCTIGGAIDVQVSKIFKSDPLYSLALDGLGNAAVEALAKQACRHFEAEARDRQMEISIPLSPGMDGWPVEKGQDLIFRLVPAQKIGVELNQSWIMVPRKSLSMVLGIGEHLARGSRQCDYCNLSATCRYRDHYA